MEKKEIYPTSCEEQKSFHNHNIFRRYDLVCAEEDVWWPDDYYFMGTRNEDGTYNQIVGPAQNVEELYYMVNNYDDWQERVAGKRWNDESWLHRGQYVLGHHDTDYYFQFKIKEFKSLEDAQKGFAAELRKMHVRVLSDEEAKQEGENGEHLHFFFIKYMFKDDYLNDDVGFDQYGKNLWRSPYFLER